MWREGSWSLNHILKVRKKFDINKPFVKYF
jgi:hypothetical protein